MIDRGTVISVNISKEKGTVKESVPFCELVPEYGILGDAHAGKWHRQVSLLSYESFCAFRDRGFDIAYIHYTHIDHWYAKLGYKTVLRWNRDGVLWDQGDEAGADLS